jgi:two-component system NtrC family sensor kinase
VNVASKITLIACLAFVPILGVHTWLSLEREEKLFRSDLERDLSVLGAHLRERAAAEWRQSGSDGVGAIIDATFEADNRVAIEWRPVPLGTRGVEEGKGTLAWVEPVTIDGTTVGEIVLTESLAPMHAYLRSTLMRLGLLMLFLILGGLLVARFLGRRLIGRRLDRLVAFAAETGGGRLGQRVDVGGDDEITRLGHSLGAMSENLAQARRNTEQLNDERMTMLQQLRHADRLASLGRLASSVAHELGTPLNVVMGHANRISGGSQAPAETKESAAKIHRQVRKMETIIRDILGFARLAPDEEAPIDLNSVVDSVCGLLLPLALRRGVQLEVDGALTPAVVRGYEVQLEQALSNLVSNAIDASPEGGRVVVGLTREERVPRAGGKAQSVIVIRVNDQGAGVSAANIDRLFEPFYTSKAAGHGTGLGLWLTDGIVRDHEGSIEVNNRSDGGACFAMVLPEGEVE